MKFTTGFCFKNRPHRNVHRNKIWRHMCNVAPSCWNITECLDEVILSGLQHWLQNIFNISFSVNFGAMFHKNYGRPPGFWNGWPRLLLKRVLWFCKTVCWSYGISFSTLTDHSVINFIRLWSHLNCENFLIKTKQSHQPCQTSTLSEELCFGFQSLIVYSAADFRVCLFLDDRTSVSCWSTNTLPPSRDQSWFSQLNTFCHLFRPNVSMVYGTSYD